MISKPLVKGAAIFRFIADEESESLELEEKKRQMG